MVKMVYCLRRKEGLSLADFQRYWREVHGPLVRKHAAALRIRRYVQVHTLDHPLNQALGQRRGNAPEVFDGVAELWWDSLADFLAAGQTEEGRKAAQELLEDERNFIDLGRSAVFLAEEHPVVV
jgi:uncharacterized protein (TIGR02118 family)